MSRLKIRILIGVAVGLGLLAAVGVMAYRKFRSFQKPTVQVVSVKATKVRFKGGLAVEVDVVATLNVTNRNDFDINLRDLTYALNSEGQTVALGGVKTVSMPAETTSQITARGTIALRGALLAAEIATRKDYVDYELAVAGRVRVLTGVSVGFSRSREGRLPTINRLRWRVHNLRLTGKLWRPGLTMDLEVINPNAFDMKVLSLSGAVKFGANELAKVSQPGPEVVGAGATATTSVQVDLLPKNVAGVWRKILANPRALKFVGSLEAEPAEPASETPSTGPATQRAF